MATIPEDLTSQVDGIATSFTTVNDISNGVLVTSNGLEMNVGNITIDNANQFTVTGFTLVVGDTLTVFINPVIFNITSQVDGIKTLFQKDVSDTLQGEFIAIVNGLVLLQETTTVDDDSFNLPFAPQIGDELEYFRVIEKTIISLPLDGEIKAIKIAGSIGTNKLNGSIKTVRLSGAMTQNALDGKIKTTMLTGELD